MKCRCESIRILHQRHPAKQNVNEAVTPATHLSRNFQINTSFLLFTGRVRDRILKTRFQDIEYIKRD